MPKPISAADRPGFRVVIVTLDHHLAGAVERARATMAGDMPGLALGFHAASDWEHRPEALEACRADIAAADIVLVTMLFMEDHVAAVLPQLRARREACAAMIGCMSAPEIVKLTRIGRFTMDGSQRSPLDFLKKLRGNREKNASVSAKQLAMLKRIPRILRFIPGTAQDVRAYFLSLQYFLAGSDDNVVNLVRFLLSRYGDVARLGARGPVVARPPVEYPETGVYHPRMKGRIGQDVSALPRLAGPVRGRVGVLVMRSYLLAGNSAHYDGVIGALEARGLEVVPCFASGLDARPAIEAYFQRDGKPTVDAFLSLTGFSLVGGPAYNDSRAAEDVLAALDLPYLAAHALEFQTVEEWEASERGLLPVEAMMMVAIPELDGATGPAVFGGRSGSGAAGRDMKVHPERARALAARLERLVTLRRTPRAERRLAIVIFNFPPNAGATGTAAYLSVHASLFNTLVRLKAEGYTVDVPESEDALRERILGGNAARFGAGANVHASISADDHVRRERHLAEIEAQWGPAPGRHQTDGRSIFVLGERFGNVFVGVQPAFGYEGDPMRLLFERGFAPTHAFAAFYGWLKQDFAAHAVLHFGTHGALEFMPGKQVGMSAACWPERLIGDLPNYYLYAANNPSEGSIAKRRAGATLISYLTPSLAQAGLYRGLIDLKASLERWRGLGPEAAHERGPLAALIQTQASQLDLAPAEPTWTQAEEPAIAALTAAVLELEYTLIPHGLHVVGAPPSPEERRDTLATVGEAAHGARPTPEALEALVAGMAPEDIVSRGIARDGTSLAMLRELRATDRLLAEDHELPALVHALDGRYVRPVAGGDVLRTPAVLPTGRNIHGFDPYRIPSAFAMQDGERQVALLLARYRADGNRMPESLAMVLWGTDNLKTEGGPIAQALALVGARPRFDAYGRLSGAQLVPLETLGRPRIDIVVTLSGIFRDLLPLQTRLIAEACHLAASADEPEAMNFVRKRTLALQASEKIDLETAALRVFSNAEGAYGSNVNHLVDGGAWADEEELAETFSRRKCFAYGRSGRPVQQAAHLKAVLAGVEMAYQNLDSVELGVTSVDHFFDSLGGMGRAVARARGAEIPIYISDQTRGEGKVRSLSEQVALETRTRMLNPKWYEGMLKHGYEGVRQIEAHVTNTVGWSATTGQVSPWVYEQITRTYVLDAELRERMAQLNPTASARVANRLIEAHERGYWSPDPTLLQALMNAGEELEDRLEGVSAEAAE